MTAPEHIEVSAINTGIEEDLPLEDGPYAGMTDLQRVEAKLDTVGEMLNGIMLIVHNAERAILNGPMGKMITGRAANGNRP